MPIYCEFYLPNFPRFLPLFLLLIDDVISINIPTFTFVSISHGSEEYL